jgi:serine protease inhibitor
LANGLFVQKNHPIRDTYIQSLKKYYAANATNVDFAAHADRATEVINS